MTPYELKLATTKQLRAAREAMLELEYLLALEKLSPAERRQAALQLSGVQLAYLRLRAAKIVDIRGKLVANDRELKAGLKSLERALKDFKQAKRIISAVGTVLGIVGRILPAT